MTLVNDSPSREGLLLVLWELYHVLLVTRMSGAENTMKVKLLPALRNCHLEGLFDAAFHVLQMVTEVLLDAL